MGGGIVSIPYAYAVAGPEIGFTVQGLVVVAILIACMLYLRTRSILQCGTSFTQLANMCLGRYSSIFINGLIALAVFGILTLYLLLFSKIAIQIVMAAYTDAEDSRSILASKTVYIVALCVLITPITLRKRLQELKLTTYVLVFGVVCLTILLSAKLCLEGSYQYRVEHGITQPLEPVGTTEHERSLGERTLDSINIAVASQGFVIALFPIYGDMQKAARPRMMVSILSALTFTCACYTYLSFVSMSYFGKRNIQQSIFENMKASDDTGTRLLLFLFLIIFCCNIPFLFFAGKVSIIAIC